MRRLSRPNRPILSPLNRRVRVLTAGLVVLVAVVGPMVAGTLWMIRHGVLTAALEAVQSQGRAMLVAGTGRVGMVLQFVSVEGRDHTPVSEILTAVGVAQGEPLLGLDPARARQQLEALPWVKEAIVERRLPATLHIRLTERTPIALWQHDGRYALVDPDGRVIEGEGLNAYAGLPQIAGAGAPEAASDLFTMLAAAPSLGPRVKAAVRVGQRRWDLWVDDLRPGRGVVIHLPESRPAEALKILIALEAKDHVLERDIAGIDLRIPDRLVVQLSERAAAMAAAASAASKGKSKAPPAPLPHSPEQAT